MTLIVEDGSAKSNSESYASVAEADTYHGNFGHDDWSNGGTSDKEAALRRATQWIDGAFRNRFMGYRREGRHQALEWPREGVYDEYEPYGVIEDTEIPIELKQATMEAALRELATPGALSPDVIPGQVIRSFSISGGVTVEYDSTGGADGQRPVMSVIGGILARILSGAGGGSPMFGQSTRG